VPEIVKADWRIELEGEMADQQTIHEVACVRRMVLHARETAVSFYQNLGYSRFGDQFTEVTIPHWAKEKRL
jgi:predicted GNAT family N-acyltransferase